MMRAWRTTAVVVCWAAVTGTSACSMVAQPDAAAWDDQAEQALTDAMSEVATARLALETADRERTWSSYTTVLVSQAEESLGTLQDDLSRAQVPSGREDDADEVEALLDDAASTVQQARQHAVDGRYDDAGLLDDLASTARRLERAASAGPGGG